MGRETIVLSMMHDIMHPKKLVILEVTYETAEHYLRWVEDAILEANDLLKETMRSMPETSEFTVELQIIDAKSSVSAAAIRKPQLSAAE